ncbi:hypothetical protein [Paracoccus sp. J39]|uniref:hypothetical protein n=1 Tax=Paracoccus sp. J39 TaxID=935848 RepID=UPI00048B6355|nr:hypothetical protein [Paracoccus sp. J39]
MEILDRVIEKLDELSHDRDVLKALWNGGSVGKMVEQSIIAQVNDHVEENSRWFDKWEFLSAEISPRAIECGMLKARYQYYDPERGLIVDVTFTTRESYRAALEDMTKMSWEELVTSDEDWDDLMNAAWKPRSAA